MGGFVPDQNNDLLALAGLNYGYEITLDGAPQAGDSFNIDYNLNGFGDNRNMLSLGELQQAARLDNGQSTFQAAFGRMVSDVGTRTKASEINLAAEESLLQQTRERREIISGVNLDEEAAKLVKFEHTYQAAAQVVSIARSLFQTVIDAAG